MTDQAEIAAATEPKNRFAKITLSQPIKRGETEIVELTLRKPKASELRGLTLQDILTTDIGAIITIIPRISDPILLKDEAEDLEADDLAEIGGAIRSFFMTAAETKAVEMYIADQLPKT
ncbi:phage tail assembly protein [Sphingobium sp.]|uniref:phage tail assembly protein n=1 Tax=Sphingobium sp. TaxID=1912891 RepID=UPI0028BD45EE|nr:phage tail assembly protein [Sphingobium sp.]